MDVRIVAGGVASPAQTQPSASPGGGEGFTRLMDHVLGPQREADQAVVNLAAGRTDQLHEVLLSIAKADLTFRLMLEVRNRLTEAYQEVQRMQV